MNQRDESWRSELEHGRGVTNEWGAARGYGSGADELAYGGGQGRYSREGRHGHGWEAGSSQPYYGPRGYWRDRPSRQQDPYGFGQRTHWREPYQGSDSYQGRDPYQWRDPMRERPFGHREEPHYYGTGAPGWGGPGFTGGANAYGDASRYQQQTLEGEYSDESTVSYEEQLNRDYRGERRTRRYPPGPKGYQRSDERLREDISERLFGAYHVDSSEVTISVTGGKVSLEGLVPSRHMKHAIEDMVDACPGVVEIDNRIRVVSPNYQGSNPKLPTTQPISASKSKQ